MDKTSRFFYYVLSYSLWCNYIAVLYFIIIILTIFVIDILLNILMLLVLDGTRKIPYFCYIWFWLHEEIRCHHLPINMVWLEVRSWPMTSQNGVFTFAHNHVFFYQSLQLLVFQPLAYCTITLSLWIAQLGWDIMNFQHPFTFRFFSPAMDGHKLPVLKSFIGVIKCPVKRSAVNLMKTKL